MPDADDIAMGQTSLTRRTDRQVFTRVFMFRNLCSEQFIAPGTLPHTKFRLNR